MWEETKYKTEDQVKDCMVKWAKKMDMNPHRTVGKTVVEGTEVNVKC